MTAFVDTSALFALLDQRDRDHNEARLTFRRLLADDVLITHNYVHVEAIALTARRLGREAVGALVDDLLPVISTVWVDENLHRTALEAQRARSAAASFVDHVSFVLMRQTGVRVAFAFDQDFEREGFERPTRVGEIGRLSEVPAPYRAGEAAADDRGGDLVSVSEIAARAGRSVHTVQSWRRRHPDFPSPLAQLAAGPIWTWPAIQGWLESRST
ncbi:MAG TPA: PIN domain-containing protein [Candidatus Dormibacteraeota bacterium]|jgi:predicted nucleic acid-binding protein